MSKKIPKITVSPLVTVCHDEKDEGYDIEVELPGVKKEDVDLSFWSKGFCVEGKKEDMVYTGCYTLGHDIKAEGAKAKFESGLLKIKVPFKEKLRAVKVKVE